MPRLRLLLLLLAATSVQPALAADFLLVQSQPINGAMLDRLDRLELVFNAPVDLDATKIEIFDVLGRRLEVVGLARDAYDRKVMRARVAGRPQSGPVRIDWKAKSLKGDEGRGRLSVVIRRPAEK